MQEARTPLECWNRIIEYVALLLGITRPPSAAPAVVRRPEVWWVTRTSARRGRCPF
jgi:hypothetical protein